jgi:glutamine phosphoribosylpyrophosphate amidotransferase
MALAHNGNLTNTGTLHADCLPGMLQPMTTSDSEMMMVAFSNNISKVLSERSQRGMTPRGQSPRGKRRRVALLTPEQILQVRQFDQ